MGACGKLPDQKSCLRDDAVTPPGLRCKIVEIGELPLYNEYLEGQVAAWARFRDEIAAADAVLFTTPEYNRSMPGCLKNAIDVGSRPAGKSAWSGKAAGGVSVSPSSLGGFGANHAVRQTLVFLDMPVMQQLEVYIGKAGELFGKDGWLTNEGTREFLGKFMTRFETWVGKIKR